MATRQEYTSCVGQGMKGKKLSKEERNLEFCVIAKLCSKKVETREEGIRLCNLPKEPKPEKRTVGNLSACECRLKQDEQILEQIADAAGKNQWETVKTIIGKHNV